MGAIACAIGAACSFPDVSFAPAGIVEGGPAESGEGSVDGAKNDAGKPVGANEDVEESGATSDATTAPDSQRIEGGAGCCDCDNDTFMIDGGMCAKAPRDCDDLNPYIYPSQTFVSSPVWDSLHIPTYDWNCDGVPTKQYNYDMGKCSTHAKLDVGGCGQYQGGFEGNPQCGQSGHYVVVCGPDPNIGSLNCIEMQGDNRVQGCR